MVRPQKWPWLGPQLPLDLVLEIAGRTDPATLVRCAATCKDVCRSVGDGKSFHWRSFRHGDRFVRGLLRGHLVRDKDDEIKHVAANAAWSSSPADHIPLALPGRLLAACDGLILVRDTTDHQRHDEELRVYSSATGMYQTVPRHHLSGKYTLLVGDVDVGGGTIVGRSFKVVNTRVTAANQIMPCTVSLQNFTSERGRWSPRFKIPSPLRHPRTLIRLLDKPLISGVVAVHWLFSTNGPRAYHILTTHVVGAGMKMTSTELPTSFPHCHPDQVLLATASPGGSPIVLVADVHKISAWSRSERTGKWRRRPQMVISYAAITGRSRRVVDDLDGNVVELRWFGARSGVVLIRVPNRGELWWLDLRSKEVIRTPTGCSFDDTEYYFPYEMDLSAWVPTFHNTV